MSFSTKQLQVGKDLRNVKMTWPSTRETLEASLQPAGQVSTGLCSQTGAYHLPKTILFGL